MEILRGESKPQVLQRFGSISAKLDATQESDLFYNPQFSSFSYHSSHPLASSNIPDPTRAEEAT